MRDSLSRMTRTRSKPVVLARRGELSVERDPARPSGRRLLDCEMEASYVDLADATHLEFDYLRWMRTVLGAAPARRVLHLGGGGCALPRALAAEDPRGHQEVCEVDAEVLALAREHLGLRRLPGLRVRHAEGRTLLARQPPRSFDAVVIDAFVGARVPRRLVSLEGLGEAVRVAPLVLVNVVDDRGQREVARVAAGLSAHCRRTWALGGRAGNTVVVGEAGGHALALSALAPRIAADPSPARLVSPSELARRAAACAPLRDDAV